MKQTKTSIRQDKMNRLARCFGTEKQRERIIKKLLIISSVTAQRNFIVPMEA